VVPANFNDAANVQAGAREFAEHGCANCHGAPGVNWAKYSEGMQPDPPDLKEVVNDLTPEQLFWVIKNGINMTGMPSFALAGAKDDDIWKIVAFLKKLPSVKEADYKAWTAPPAPAATPATPPAATSAPAVPAPAQNQ
jgi:mono/diheme cytochrome c family protein